MSRRIAALIGLKAHALNYSQLNAGEVDDVHFQLLIVLSGIHSPSVIQALRIFLVTGVTRKFACARFGVSQGYFSLKLRQLYQTSQVVELLLPYYNNEEVRFIKK